MAHEFKTPLTNIRLATNMLKKKHNDQLLDIIAAENNELTENVNHVLSMASLENGQYQLEKENVNILGLIQEIVDQFSIRMEETKGQLNIHNKSLVETIYADRFHLSNVIKNILDNAIKYNENNPVINIILENEGNNLKISIHDNGIGIRKTEQKLIFEKFFRIKEGDTYDEKGFGIGLSYVKRIIELHKGNITVNSEWKKGSSFSLMLPKI
jgi:two-component system phosphate regulon sensor histidine kinase PhoR